MCLEATVLSTKQEDGIMALHFCLDCSVCSGWCMMRFYNLTRIVLTIYRRLSVDLPNNHIDTQLCNLEITMPLLISCRFLVIMCSSLPSIFLARRSTTLHMQVSFMCFRISQLMDIPLVALSAIFIAGMLHKAPLRWLFTFFYVQ